MDEDREQLQLSKYLPHPLFVIFSETRAYAQVYGNFYCYKFKILLIIRKGVKSSNETFDPGEGKRFRI